MSDELDQLGRQVDEAGDRQLALAHLRDLAEHSVNDEVKLQAALSLLEASGPDDGVDLTRLLEELTDKVAEQVLERVDELRAEQQAASAAS